MTTNHHTPLAFGGPLTSAAMEAPLSQLDTAIAGVITTGSGTSTSLTAQALSGQASLTVANSAGFIAGDPIYIGTGAIFEARLINNVPNATTIVVTVNLTNTYAIGAPVSKSPVEIVDARGGHASLGVRLGLMEPFFNVKRYGATGDGTTNDTAAINAAITALNAVGRGVLYFPAGIYQSTGGHVLPNNTTILGDGAATPGDNAQFHSMVRCTSATAVLFHFQWAAGRVERIAFDCSAVATAGAAVQVSNTIPYFLQSVDFDAIRVSRFYIGVDVQVGTHWTMRSCMFLNNILYGAKVQNTQDVDAGDWSISDSTFVGVATTSGIRVQSSGGGKITNCKFNGGIHGIDLAVAASVTTSILLISDCSIENVSGDGVHGTTSAGTSKWSMISVQGCQFGLYGNTGGHAVSLVATTAGDFSNVVIEGNVLAGEATTGSAFLLTKCNLVRIGPHERNTFPSLLALTTCTNLSGAIGENGVLARLVAPIAIANTETSILAPSVPAGFLRVGTTFRFSAYGRLTSGGTPGSSIISIRAGSAVAYYATLTIVNTASKTNAPFKIEAYLTVRTLGVGGTAIGQVDVRGGILAPFTSAGDLTPQVTAVALDTTLDCPVLLQYQSGNAGTTATFENAIIEVLNAA